MTATDRPEHEPATVPGEDVPGDDVVVGVVAAPGVAGPLTQGLPEDLQHALAVRLPGVRWRVQLVEDPLVRPPAEDWQIVDAARRVLLTADWDLALVLTDLPLEVDRRPVVAHASPLHGVGVLSVPALGSVSARRRARQTLLRLVDALLGEAGGGHPGSPPDAGELRRLAHRARELGADVDTADQPVRFTTRVLTGHLRLLVGMVRTNRPWQLATGLSRALIAAGAAGVFALVTSDIWRLADAFGWLRLSLVAVGSVGAIAATVVLGGGLLERAADPGMRQQVVLFNLATTATVVIGVLALYLTLFALSLLAALLLVVPTLLSDALTHSAAVSDYVELAWLTSSLATVGGALGAGLESDESVRRAAYTRRADPVAPAGD